MHYHVVVTQSLVFISPVPILLSTSRLIRLLTRSERSIAPMIAVKPIRLSWRDNNFGVGMTLLRSMLAIREPESPL